MIAKPRYDLMPAGSRFEGLTVLQAAVLVARLKFHARREDLALVFGCSVRNIAYIQARLKAKGFSIPRGSPGNYTIEELERYVCDFFNKFGVYG